jgi:predicted cupin superfamily sugar epimerase
MSASHSYWKVSGNDGNNDRDDYETIHFLVQEYKLFETHKMEAEFMMHIFFRLFLQSVLVNMTTT